MHSSTLRELLSQIATAAGVSIVLGFFSAGPLCAWEGETHRLITRLALQNDPSLQQQTRPKTSTQPILSGELQNRLDTLSHQWQ